MWYLIKQQASKNTFSSIYWELASIFFLCINHLHGKVQHKPAASVINMPRRKKKLRAIIYVNPTTFNMERNSLSKHIPWEKKKVRFPALPHLYPLQPPLMFSLLGSSLEGPSPAKGWNYRMQDSGISWKRPTRITESSPWPISRTPALIRTLAQQQDKLQPLLPASRSGQALHGLGWASVQAALRKWELASWKGLCSFLEVF